MDDEEKAGDGAATLGDDLRQALFDALTPDDFALIAEARAAMGRRGKKRGSRKARGEDDDRCFGRKPL